MATSKSFLFDELKKTIEKLDTHSISEERQELLKSLTQILQSKVRAEENIRLNFICTHNSRRSHLAQVWAKALAKYFNIDKVHCYSAGTEVTVVYPEILNALSSAGFQVNQISEGSNPIYSIKYGANIHPIIGFSKSLENDFNPKSEFIAVMTCDAANESCPTVRGAENRISITFKDPKAFDQSPLKAEKYKETSLQIAAEMYYVFSQIKLRG